MGFDGLKVIVDPVDLFETERLGKGHVEISMGMSPRQTSSL
jgi:hypothetical protein